MSTFVTITGPYNIVLFISDVEPMSRSTTATATIMPEPKQEKMVAEKGAEENRGGEAEKGGDQGRLSKEFKDMLFL